MVAYSWGIRKGLDTAVRITTELGKKYKVVIVGTNEKIDNLLPQSAISIHRTANQCELAEIYSAADLFVNPTMEEVLGMVNLESLACGTPVLTYKAGGAPECIDSSCGEAVDLGDVDAMLVRIKDICEKKPYHVSACRNFARKFDMRQKYRQYADLYEKKI